MKGVLLATDYVKDNDGSFKILETNTSIVVATNYFKNYFNSQSFIQLINDNGIDEVYVILPKGSVTVDVNDLNKNEGDNISYWAFGINDGLPETITFEVKVSQSNLFPSIDVEDAPNRLLLRVCFDTNALIDETYAKDNFNFFKLLYDNNSSNICPTYFNDGNGISMDLLGTDLRDNGAYPNYIIKNRYPTSDYNEYPKVLKVNSVEDLNILKGSLLPDELLQEYIINTDDLVEGKIKTYRTVHLLYGNELNVLDFMTPYIHTNRVPIDPDVDYKPNGQIELWERPKFIQKIGNKNLNKNYHTYSVSKVIDSNGNLRTVNSMSVGESVRSLSLYNLNLDNDHRWPSYSEPVSQVYPNSPLASSVIISNNYGSDLVVISEITLEDGTIFLNGLLGVCLTVDPTDNVVFKEVKNLKVGDKLVIHRFSDDQMESKTITDVSFTFKEVIRHFFDVEERDLYFIVEDSESPTYYMVQHNPPGVCSCYRAPASSGCFCPEPCLTPDQCLQEGEIWGQLAECCSTNPICEGKAAFDAGEALCQDVGK